MLVCRTKPKKEKAIQKTKTKQKQMYVMYFIYVSFPFSLVIECAKCVYFQFYAALKFLFIANTAHILHASFKFQKPYSVPP